MSPLESTCEHDSRVSASHVDDVDGLFGVAQSDQVFGAQHRLDLLASLSAAREDGIC